MQENKSLLPIAIIVAGIIVAGAVYITNRSGTTPSGTSDHTQNDGEINIPDVTSSDHILGNPNAQLVIVEYSDLECPFCKNFHITLQAIIDEYGADGRVAWVYRHFPLANLHSKAPREALATECVAELGGNEAFWEYLDIIFEVTPSNNGLDLDLLPELAVQVGVDEKDFNTCMDEERYADLVEQQFNDALASGGQGTPYSVIIARTGQTVPVEGAQSFTTLKEIIDALLGNTEE